MQVHLTQDQTAVVERAVAAGEARDAADFIHRLIATYAATPGTPATSGASSPDAAVTAKIERGMAEIRAGRGIEARDAMRGIAHEFDIEWPR